jgi:hypothetical protein
VVRLYRPHFRGRLSHQCRPLPGEWAFGTQIPLAVRLASPPGVDDSPALVNVLWGFANLVIGYGLLAGVGPLAFSLSLDALAVALGALLMGWRLASHFGGLTSNQQR